jgi:hypothetical protein
VEAMFCGLPKEPVWGGGMPPRILFSDRNNGSLLNFAEMALYILSNKKQIGINGYFTTVTMSLNYYQFPFF